MKKLGMLVAGLCVAAPLSAQLTPFPVDTAAALETAWHATLDPLLESTARSTTPGVTVEFTSEEQTARAQIGGGMGSLRRWGLAFVAPIADGDETTTLATREGLSGGTTAEFLLRQVTSPSDPEFTDDEFQRICERYVRPELRKEGEAVRGCTRGELTPEGKRMLDERAFRGVWEFGGSIKVGRREFSFTDPVTFADGSETHEGWSISGFLGHFPAGSSDALLYYVGLSYRHEDAYVGNGESNVCTPVEGSPSMLCRDIAIGAPSRRSSELFQLEARSFPGAGLALAPRVTYEAGRGEWAAEVPVYLRQGSGPFNGGVSVGWDSEEDDIRVSVFIGALPTIP